MEKLEVQDIRRRSGWFWIDNEVFEMALDPYSFMVYAYLVRIADRASEVASISLRKIERALRISRKKLVQALRELEEKRMIIKKQRKGEKGNYYSNIYILTSKEDWHYPRGGLSRSTGVVSDGNHGGVSRKPGVVSDGNHGGLPEQPPSTPEEAKNFENQWKGIAKKCPIKNNKNQKNKNNQKSSSPYIEGSGTFDDGGGDDKSGSLKEKTIKESDRRNKQKAREKRRGSKEDKENSTLKNFAAGGSESVNPEEVFRKLKKKWQKFLYRHTFKRLTEGQVIFFLENSALKPEETLAIIKKDDENPKIENPVGTLYTSLPLKSENYRWLLKYEEEVTENNETTADKKESEDWKRKFRQKLELLESVGVKLSKIPEPKTEEEAEKTLKDIKKKLYEKILKKLSENELEEIEAILESEKKNNPEFYEELKMGLVLERKGFREGMFSLYVA